MARREAYLDATPDQIQERIMQLLGQMEDEQAAGQEPYAGHRGGYSLQDGREASFDAASVRRDPLLTVLLPILILLSTLLFLLIAFIVFVIVVKRNRRRGIQLLDHDGPLDLAREEELEGDGGLAGIEERWLEQQDDNVRAGYQRAKLWQQQYLPNSTPSDITLSQFLSIQEKGVSAWSFEPDYETNSPLFVTSRTEITFLEDGIGMAAQEGGACCVQSNLPLPRLNEVYYWEVKLFEKPESTTIAVGLSTKPYPSFRMPGWNRYSIGYFSSDGFKAHNYPFTAQSYGPPLKEGDVLGVGYRPRTGAVFFTRNGKKLEDAYIGLTKHNLFPTVAADGAATLHVNLGQAGFVFIEANVKKWGLAPMMGTLAPPPAYGSERGSILLETHEGPQLPQIPQVPTQAIQPRQTATDQAAVAALTTSPVQPEPGSSRTRVASHRRVQSHSTVPIRPSPLRTSMTRQRTSSYNDSQSGSAASSPLSIPGATSPGEREDASGESDEELLPHNPPTPGQLDISLRAMSPFSRRIAEELRDRAEEREAERREQQRNQRDSQSSQADYHAPAPPTSSTPPYTSSMQAPASRPGDISPPAYQLIDANQYPAGVAEAMLETMPEDQLAALFANAGHGGTPSSVQSFENRTGNPQNSDGQSSGFRGFFGFGRSSDAGPQR